MTATIEPQPFPYTGPRRCHHCNAKLDELPWPWAVMKDAFVNVRFCSPTCATKHVVWVAQRESARKATTPKKRRTPHDPNTKKDDHG